MDRADLSPLLRSFERHLRAANRADTTIASYLASLRQAEAFLAARDVGLLEAERADLEAFLGDLLARQAASTAATRYKVLRLFHQRLEEEGEVTSNPTAKLRPPIVPEQPVPVVPEDGLRRLLATCAGKGFNEVGYTSSRSRRGSACRAGARRCRGPVGRLRPHAHSAGCSAARDRSCGCQGVSTSMVTGTWFVMTS
jgi:integrase